MYTVGIITLSDKGSKGEREDISGKLIKKIVEDLDYEVKKYIVLPDEKRLIEEELKYQSDNLKVNIIFTTGGTGFSKRDVTPEATLSIIDRQAMGISEAIRYYSLKITPRAMLSRAVSGIRGDTLIINLPGSPKAVEEALTFILDSVKHGIEILIGSASECARK
ncbi:molybdopterin biosynthesis mog family protein [Clostridiales bacterium oral taxon 876 str. F0540]|nr:molybdopterin biosynthesis mog family protein [Clostridiales bacterium oral taxon 876 str. F0540]